MGSYEETMASLSEMKSRFQSGFSSSDRLFLDKLHRLMFGSEITKTGCSDCYRDAYVIIFSTLKKNKEMPKTPNYILKGGAIIHPVGTSRFYTNPLPSDDIAEEFLSNFPNEINKFAQYPVDWEERIAAFVKRKEAQKEAEKALAETSKPASDENIAKEIEALKAQLEEAKKAAADANTLREKAENKVKELEFGKSVLEKQIEELSAALENTTVADGEDGEESDEVSQLRMELETAKTELEAANSEIEKLKTDNRALKAANTRLKNNSTKDAE